MDPATDGASRPRELRALTAIEARVLGVLIEKERTVPDTYPLTLNALVAGCNQKSNRNPTLDVRDAEVLAALDALQRLSLVIESSGSRVMRYSQNFKRVLQVPTESVALLATLMLRGPQTGAELRANSERLCRISDVSATEAFLQELAERPAGALVLQLPRQAGSRESRWMHRLCGDPHVPQSHMVSPASHSSVAGPRGDTVMAIDLPQVQTEVAMLLERYVQALVADDGATVQSLFWESPKALLDHVGGEARTGFATDDSAWSITATRLVCFGRDFATSVIALSSAGSAGSAGSALDRRRTWHEGQTWVRLEEGWRIVATHRGQG